MGLRTAVHDIIDATPWLSYAQVCTALQDTDEDPSNSANMAEVYSGRSISMSLKGGGVGRVDLVMRPRTRRQPHRRRHRGHTDRSP